MAGLSRPIGWPTAYPLPSDLNWGWALTLILMGHEISKSEIRENFVLEHEKAGSQGLFAVADSALTRKGEEKDGRVEYRTLLTGLKKVHELTIRIARPDILRNGHFQSFQADPAYHATAFLAFAGNAYSAHHALDAIREDLGGLRLSFRYPHQPGEPKDHVVIRSRDANPMHADGVAFDQDMFFGSEIEGLFRADYFAHVVKHSIENALQSVVTHCQTTRDISLANATFAFGVWCPVERTHKLYHLEPKRITVEGRYQLVVIPTVVPEGEVLALGMESVIATLPIQDTYNDALASSTSPAKALQRLMDGMIDRDHAAFTGYPINRPISRIHLKENHLRRF
ncbi:hypothetical protein [Pseudoxanthomonas daejeonensis]|uniref:Uncharacterized protein n=1 Tax=Pseudoxanthomonas daejeonensis TaxID=266062 RepID=A0ABQ6Z976_9GAMM|nr:hypothetical protein [Pseudoxanthomonas daejeonensis]KAF1696039.1 hypothetical protein CSC65_05950 [Pseudoxanthomonas daejeonensis]